MATLVLDRVWINLVATGQSMNAYSKDRGRQMAVDGEVRTYGGGRRRAVIAVGRLNTVPFTLVQLSELQVVNLEEWMGLLVMFRDHRGQRFVGTYFGMDFKERKPKDRWDIGLTLHEVTWVEGVV